jgi:quercetin dioxygenase-like cupin family protein
MKAYSGLHESSQYQNLLDNLTFTEGKPSIQTLHGTGGTQLKKVMLASGTELKCHKTEQHVTVIWLRGKAKFHADGEEFTMHPGSMLTMPSGTPHGATAETDCVFLVIKIA